MVTKIPLYDPRLKRSMALLGWAVFGLALLSVYVLPHWMYSEAFKLVDGKIEALLIALAVIYIYVYPSKPVPWLILLVLAVGESSERPHLAVIITAVSLTIALAPTGWAGNFSDFTKGQDDNDDDLDNISF